MNLPKIDSILYNVTIPSNNLEIKVRQLRAKDEKILLTAKESSGTAEERNVEILNSIKQVINNAIVTPGINVEKLALFDIEFLFIKLRALSVSNIITASYADNEELTEYYAEEEKWKNNLLPTEAKPVEPKPYEFQIDLNKVTVKWPNEISQEIKIPGNDITVKMKYPDASLYTNHEFLAASGERLIDFLIQNSLESIQKAGTIWHPKPGSDPELREFLDELPIGVYDKIRDFLSNLPHLFYEISYKNKLGNERKIVLDKLSDFFSF